MMKKLLMVSLVAVLAPLALADKGDPSYVLQSRDGTNGTNDFIAGPATRAVTPVPLGGLDSWDEFGNANNAVFSVPLAPSAHVIGIGWDTSQYAISPSWLSEMRVEMTNTAISTGVGLTPGIGNNFGGPGAYSSGGIVDLIGLGLDFNVDADGLLRFELWETFNDFPGGIDGHWLTPSIIQVEWVPEPASLTLLALGGLGLLRRRR